MIRRAATMISIWVLGLSLPPHAYGQESCGPGTDPDDATSQIEVCVVDQPSYALELFGSRVDAIELNYVDEPDPEDADAPEFSNRPKVLIELPERGPGPEDDIAPGSAATVTVRLNGAVFAERIRSSDLKLRNLAGPATGRLRVQSREGGGAGDRLVSFDVEVVGGDGLGNAADGLPVTLALHMPALTQAGDAMTAPSSPGVEVQVDVASATSGNAGFPDFPARGQTLPGGSDADDEREEEAGLRVLIRKPAPTDRALSMVGTDGLEGGTIEPRERNLVFAAPRDPAFLTVGRVALTLRDDLYQADGAPFSVIEAIGSRRNGAGAGVLAVSSVGDFGSGDRVVLDWDGDDKAGEGEALVIDAGVASADFPLEDLVPGTYEVIYFPRQDEPLRSGAIRTTFAIDFDRSGNSAPPPVREIVQLQYLNAETALPAYAIASPSATDRAHVRIRCQASVPCQVYLACDGADGVHYFGDLELQVDPRTTRTVTAREVAAVIGASEEDFAGGMSCEVFGSDITVQVLTRSGGTLANTTYVGGRLAKRVRELITEADAATRAAAAAACASIRDAASRRAQGCPM